MLLISWILSLTLALYDQSNNQIKQAFSMKCSFLNVNLFGMKPRRNRPLRNCRKCPRTVYFMRHKLRIVVHSSTTISGSVASLNFVTGTNPSDGKWVTANEYAGVDAFREKIKDIVWMQVVQRPVLWLLQFICSESPQEHFVVITANSFKGVPSLHPALLQQKVFQHFINRTWKYEKEENLQMFKWIQLFLLPHMGGKA